MSPTRVASCRLQRRLDRARGGVGVFRLGDRAADHQDRRAVVQCLSRGDDALLVAGRAIGGPKLLPAVSPKKTWAGAIAGTLGAMIVAVLVARLFGSFSTVAIAAVALLLSVCAQAGDLFESWVKRKFGVKDSSQLIPGHGGVMDRLDGFWAAAVVGCVIGLLRGGFDAPARGLLVW